MESAVFTASKDFNFKWSIRGGKITMKISDYIDDAPDEVIEDFLVGAYTFMNNSKHVFSKRYMDYIESDDFVLRKRPVFFRRSRRLTRSDIGRHRNLFDSVQRLMERGLLTESDIDNSLFSWTTGNNYTRLGYCSQMFRVVVISSVFDNLDIDENLLDYVVYHECMHLRQVYRPFNHNPHDAAFRRNMKLFPDSDAMEKKLSTIPGMRGKD